MGRVRDNGWQHEDVDVAAHRLWILCARYDAQGGNPLIQISQYLVAGFSQPQNIEAVKTLAVGWVNDMFAGTHDGIYGAPQQTIQIGTSAGTAPAVVLPSTSTQTVQATPFDGLLNVILTFLAQNVFVYEPLARVVTT